MTPPCSALPFPVHPCLAFLAHTNPSINKHAEMDIHTSLLAQRGSVRDKDGERGGGTELSKEDVTITEKEKKSYQEKNKRK
ncbi:hypothetical protein E2C01_066189 [Portunus trituberculatus]|uniref:Uncharacterized protein n=1 Tax=Portunus trituberculatus TaxID=210409 RepID=A0A5B7HT62_PORTR|nr:hypothetical protein [Portunus trituberculatus]